MDNLTIKGSAGKKYISVQGGNVIITREKSLFAAKREKAIPIANISGVEVKKPGALLNGFIQIQIAGQSSANSSFKFTGGAYDAVSDENAVVFGGKENYETAQKIKDYIQNYTQQPQAQATSSADEIVKFKSLLDAGVITQDEYDAKKKQLLNI